MHEYMTRHMVALRPLVYDHQSLEPGDEFRCTPDDAGYFTKHGKARDAGHVPPYQVPSHAPIPPQPVAVFAEPESSGVSGVSEVSDGSAVMTTQDWSAPRRRGRPTNAELAERAARAAQPPAAAATPTEDA